MEMVKKGDLKVVDKAVQYVEKADRDALEN